MGYHRRNDFLIPTVAVLFDSIAIEAAFLLSYWVRFDTSLLNFLPLMEATPPLDAYIYGSFIIIPVWLALFNSRNMYGARRNVPLPDELFSIVKVVTLGMLVVMSAAFFYRAFSYSRIVFGLLWVISILTIFTGRFLLLHMERIIYSLGRELRNAVIIGDNRTANSIYANLHNHPLLGYKIVGYYAESPVRNGSLAEAKYLGTITEAPENMEKERVELALIALNHDEHPKLYKLIHDCEGVNIEFMTVPDLIEVMSSRMTVNEIEGIPFVTIKGVPMSTWGRIIKRMFDFTVSSLLIIFLSPVLLLVAVAIRAGSKGPVFFRQERVGLGGERFVMIKFRSMVEGAEQYDEDAGLGVKNDPRLTRAGKIIRRLSIDELPQLFNVIKGEMSLVGPRPERPYFVEQFKSLVPKYLDRHRVKTGMTGWAQVNGFRGSSSLEERIRYDIYYIENWSLWFDIKILLKTIKAVM